LDLFPGYGYNFIGGRIDVGVGIGGSIGISFCFIPNDDTRLLLLI